MAENLEGIEKYFIESCDGWNEIGVGDISFYNVKFVPNVFPFQIDNTKHYDMNLITSQCMIEVYDVCENVIIYQGKFKASLI